jgi:hypothetical protein
MATTIPAATATEARLHRLNTASARRLLDPDEVVAGTLGPGQILPDELLTVIDLGLDLGPEQRARLSREEVAAIVDYGLRFEAVLMAGFSLRIIDAPDLTDPRVTYLLHEMGEETRHSRLFVRLIDQLAPTGRNPFLHGPPRLAIRVGIRFVIDLPALLFTLVLGGEEIPDLIQKLAGGHPDTDPFVRAVNHYHRQEEARHIAFARLVLAEVWATAGPVDRRAVRTIAPRVIHGMWDQLVHPGVYATVGLPRWATWWAVRHSPTRVALRCRATRPVLDALVEAGVLRPGRIPRGWRTLCGVDRHARPLPDPAGTAPVATSI